MIRATIELVPYGQEAQARTLHTLTICNTGGTEQRGEYDVTLTNAEGWLAHARIENWPRLTRDAASLVQAALQACGYRRPDAEGV